MKLWHWIVCIGIVGLFGAVFFPVVACACSKASAGRGCLSQVKQIGMAHLMYAADHNDRLPHRDLWMDAVAPYVKNKETLLVDPEVKGHGQHGDAFDSRLSERVIEEVKDPEHQPLVFDSINLGKNASDPSTSLPNPGRHEGKNSIVYLDGHAKRIGLGLAK